MMKSYYCLADEVWGVDGNNLKEIIVSLVLMMSLKAVFNISTTSPCKSLNHLWSCTLIALKVEIHFSVLLFVTTVCIVIFLFWNNLIWGILFDHFSLDAWGIQGWMDWKKAEVCLNGRGENGPQRSSRFADYPISTRLNWLWQDKVRSLKPFIYLRQKEIVMNR